MEMARLIWRSSDSCSTRSKSDIFFLSNSILFNKKKVIQMRVFLQIIFLLSDEVSSTSFNLSAQKCPWFMILGGLLTLCVKIKQRSCLGFWNNKFVMIVINIYGQYVTINAYFQCYHFWYILYEGGNWHSLQLIRMKWKFLLQTFPNTSSWTIKVKDEQKRW